jgi:hypothetical protein
VLAAPAWSAGVDVTASAVYLPADASVGADAALSRTNVAVQPSIHHHHGSWSLDLALYQGVEDPHTTIARPGATWTWGLLQLRMAGQAMVRPIATWGVLAGPGLAVPLAADWALTAGVDVGWWAEAPEVIPFDGRLGARIRW